MPRTPTSDAERLRGEALGRAIRAARQEANKTSERVAVEADVSVDTLRRIEQGRIANPGVFTVAAIAGGLGTPLEALLESPGARAKT